MPHQPPRVLIIAGSDSGGGAGIQADIKTVTALGGFAMTAITAITVQDTQTVHAVHPVPPSVVRDQIRVVMQDIGADVVKTGMIGSPEHVTAVAEALADYAPRVPLVVDPVMIASDGSSLMDEGAEMIDVETVFEQFKRGVAEQVSEDDSDTHFDLGIAYKEMGLFPDARREFQVAMSDPRRRCLCWTMIGLIYMEEGQPRDAIEAFQSGLESPDRTPSETVGLHYELGLACEAAGLFEQARLHYQYVHQREPQYREVGHRLERLGGPADDGDGLVMESMDDVNRAFDALIHED